MKSDSPHKALEKIGLTNSEIKVYLSLLELGTVSKGAIVKKSGIASSKIYEITDKLIAKGLCNMILKDNIKYFSAASPSRIKEYLEQKKEEILTEEKIFSEILPQLESLQNHNRQETKVEVFIGWKGMDTAYGNLLALARSGEKVLIVGAGTSSEEEKLELFFTKYGRTAFEKKINVRVIFNESARTYVKKIEDNIGFQYTKKFLFKNTPTELTLFRDTVLLAIRRAEPIVILIHDSQTAESFKNYFQELWKIASK
jgi:sugar-specific transcriptional regulator TrmB